jgi:hypothetical protein
VTIFDFLSLKNDVIVASKSIKQKKNCVKKLVFCWHLEGQCRKWQDPDPDPLVRGVDPRIRIRIHPKMSWIRNTALKIQRHLVQLLARRTQIPNSGHRALSVTLFLQHTAVDNGAMNIFGTYSQWRSELFRINIF